MLGSPDQQEQNGEDDMSKSEMEEFAKILVQHIRDDAIKSSDSKLEQHAKSPVAKRWREAMKSGQPESIANVLISDIVDETMFHLVDAIDQGLLTLSFTATNGKTVDLVAEGMGELGGSYMGNGGWREMYSRERLVDYFADTGEFNFDADYEYNFDD